MDAVEFEAKTGHAPVDDDLARVNCRMPGKALHTLCGWCSVHDLPRWQCICGPNLGAGT